MIPKGYKQSKEWVEKRARLLRGKKRTVAQRQKISLSHIGQVPWNKGIKGEASHCFGRKLTDEQKKKISDRTSGAKNHFWKGGISRKNESIRKTSRYKLWRKSIFERDKYICQICFLQKRELHADHIKPFSLFPELRFELSNGRTLCVECHRETDTYGSRLNKTYASNTTTTKKRNVGR